MSAPTAADIDQLLPQTQCGQCGYQGCMPYAQAIIDRRANINQCPPGGQQTIQALATLLHCDAPSLNADYGFEREYQIAEIDESLCIGCVKCIRACPVDAIIGAAKQMHSVINELCTGCELCIPPCPMDCIDMSETPLHLAGNFSGYEADKIGVRDKARQRHRQRQSRISRLEMKKSQQPSKQYRIDIEAKRAFIKDAIRRSKRRRNEQQSR